MRTDLFEYMNNLEERVALKEQERIEKQKEQYQKQLENQEKEQRELQNLLNKVGKKIENENREKAEQEYQEELAKKEKELKDAINKKHYLKTEEEKAIDNDLRNMLSRMNLKD